MPSRDSRRLLVLLSIVYVWSAWQPADVATWWMEVLPVFLALPAILLLDARLGLTSLALRLLVLEAVIVAVGAHYTYARVPLGDWLAAGFGWERNPYDRIAHFFQGVVPAIFVRELLLRTSPLRPGKWLFALVCCVCLAFSAFYEFVEWWAALLFAQGATDFLGTQGDPWDTQWDMFLAFTGAWVAQVVLGGRHDHQLARTRQ